MNPALRLLGLLIGVGILAWLIARADLSELLTVFERIGYLGFAAIVAVRGATIAVDFSLSLFAQILFTLLGFVLLARRGDQAGWWWAGLSAALVPTFAPT